MRSIKPIKRSKELAPLSREHHDGLLFVWKINQGLTNNTPVENICNYVRWFWQNHLKPHFEDEEKLLTQFLPTNNPLLMQMMREHTQIREMLRSLDKVPDKSMLKILADFLNNHIRFEERKLFPFAEEVLTSEQLNSIYQQIAEEPFCNTEWKDEFWVRK